MHKCKKRQIGHVLLVFLILFFTLSIATAHEDQVVEHIEGDEHSEAEHDDTAVGTEEFIKTTSFKLTMVAFVVILALILVSILSSRLLEKNNAYKIILFSVIVIITIGTTIYVAGGTIYLNVISETKGPVHWHADFEVWSCGEKLDLSDPTGLANRIGTSTFHEHGDDRIHLEGVVINSEDVSLHNFFHVIGGTLTKNSLSLPTNQGLLDLKNGDSCDGQQGVLQVFVYQVSNPEDRKSWVFKQQKLEDFEVCFSSTAKCAPRGLYYY